MREACALRSGAGRFGQAPCGAGGCVERGQVWTGERRGVMSALQLSAAEGGHADSTGGREMSASFFSRET